MIEAARVARAATALALSLLCLSLSAATPADAPFAFYAVYRRVADHGSLGLVEIHQSAMSRDGERLVLYGRDTWGRLALLTMAVDGTGVTRIPLPEDLAALWDITLDDNGAQAFFRQHWDRAIYRLHGNVLAKLFDADDHATIQGVDEIHATGDGRWLYFRDGRTAIWRLPAAGGSPEPVLAESDVHRREGRPANLGPFRISADGATVLFRVDGFWDANNAFHLKHELFVLRDGVIRQLTDDPGQVGKEQFALSGDGTTVVVAAGPPVSRWLSLRTEGDAIVELGVPGQITGVTLNHAGTRLVYADDRSNGGRLVDPRDGVGVDLFPRYNVAAIPLTAAASLGISAAGDRLGFRFGDGVYVGHIGRSGAVASAPVIEELVLDPPLGEATGSSGAVLRARVSDPDGLADLARVSVNGLVDGATQRDRGGAALFFYDPPNDRGAAPDQIADDGIFSASGVPGQQPGVADSTSVRFAAMDAAGNVTVADAAGAGGTGSVAAAGSPAPPGEGPTTVGVAGEGPDGGHAPRADAPGTRTVEEFVEEFDSAWRLPDRAPLREDRADVQAALGWPDAFTLYWAADTEGTIRRHESWTYFAHRTVFEFIDDETLRSEEIADPGGAFLPPSRYRPTQFAGEMSEQELRALLGDLVEIELPAELGEGLRYLVGEQILLGMSPGGLEFVETLTVASPEAGS